MNVSSSELLPSVSLLGFDDLGKVYRAFSFSKSAFFAPFEGGAELTELLLFLVSSPRLEFPPFLSPEGDFARLCLGDLDLDLEFFLLRSRDRDRLWRFLLRSRDRDREDLRLSRERLRFLRSRDRDRLRSLRGDRDFDFDRDRFRWWREVLRSRERERERDLDFGFDFLTGDRDNESDLLRERDGEGVLFLDSLFSSVFGGLL
jgi:hypothetical protein